MNRSSVVTTVGLAVLSLLTPRGASAYSADIHELLTKEAVLLVRACRVPGVFDPAPHERALIDHNVRQDDLLRKARLWHFPFRPRADCDDPCRDECYTSAWCPYWSFICGMAVYRSIDPWVNHLMQRAKRARASREVYPAAGALLHYLQDLAVPAHAVPVFHPVPLLFGKDEFDEFEVKASHKPLLKRRDFRQVCDSLDDAASLLEIFHGMRAATLASLEATFPVRVGGKREARAWHVFWGDPPSEEAPEFGSYRCQRDFGEGRVRCQEGTFEVDEGTYQAFVDARAEEAILAGARLIVHLQKQLVAADTLDAARAAEEVSEQWLPSKATLEPIRHSDAGLCVPLWP